MQTFILSDCVTDDNMFVHRWQYVCSLPEELTEVGTAEKVSKQRILKGAFLRILNDVLEVENDE